MKIHSSVLLSLLIAGATCFPAAAQTEIETQSVPTTDRATLDPSYQQATIEPLDLDPTYPTYDITTTGVTIFPAQVLPGYDFNAEFASTGPVDLPLTPVLRTPATRNYKIEGQTDFAYQPIHVLVQPQYREGIPARAAWTVIGRTNSEGTFSIPIETGSLSSFVPIDVTVTAINPDNTQSRPSDLELLSY